MVCICGLPTDSIFTVGGDCTVILNPADARNTHVLAYGDTLVANDSTIFVSKSLDDEPLEVYDPAQLREYKYMKIVPKYDVEINFDANGGTGTMTDVEVAAATETDPVKCSVCEHEITPALGHTHAHGTEWKSDVCAYNVGLLTPPADPDNPQTGDNTQLGMWFALMLISVCNH